MTIRMRTMILNYFNRIKGKRSLLVYVGLSSLIAGCADFYKYGAPAPASGSVYESSERTNPYEQKTMDVKESYERTEPNEVVLEEVFEPELTPVQPEYEDIDRGWTLNRNQRKQVPVVKKTMSPAILALVTEADKRSRSGDLESAVVTIERALRIDSRNPLLTYKLAKLRLQQSKPRLAENLAKKSALLSANDKMLKKQAWLLISEARKQQKNYLGAKEAKLKANNI